MNYFMRKIRCSFREDQFVRFYLRTPVYEY